MQRNTRIVITVLLLHVAAIWALQSSLMRKVVGLIVPAEVIVEMVAPDEATPEKAKPRVEQQATPTPQRTQIAQPAPTPLATPLSIAQPNPAAAEQVFVPTAPAVAAPPALVLPSTDADYLNNPKPPYPPLSKRLREEGKVVVRTLIGADGTAQQAEIRQSSGFDRLDQAALTTALRWRYVPGKRAGVAEAMWFNLPFTFELIK